MLYVNYISIFKNEGENKTFPDKQKLRKFITNKPALQKNNAEIIFQVETKGE